jgi:hypothetical protein
LIYVNGPPNTSAVDNNEEERLDMSDGERARRTVRRPEEKMRPAPPHGEPGAKAAGAAREEPVDPALWAKAALQRFLVRALVGLAREHKAIAMEHNAAALELLQAASEQRL